MKAVKSWQTPEQANPKFKRDVLAFPLLQPSQGDVVQNLEAAIFKTNPRCAEDARSVWKIYLQFT